jgi:hypothetical protein
LGKRSLSGRIPETGTLKLNGLLIDAAAVPEDRRGIKQLIKPRRVRDSLKVRASLRRDLPAGIIRQSELTTSQFALPASALARKSTRLSFRHAAGTNADTEREADFSDCAGSAATQPNFTRKRFRNVDELKQAAGDGLEFAAW